MIKKTLKKNRGELLRPCHRYAIAQSRAACLRQCDALAPTFCSIITLVIKFQCSEKTGVLIMLHITLVRFILT